MNLNKHLIDSKEIEAIQKVLESGQFFRHRVDGGECETFEKEFAEFIGTSHSCLVTSGTNALIAALLALEIGEGDEVIVPAYTFFATISSVLSVGAKPVIVNSGSDLLLSLDEIKNNITDKTKAIIPVHMDGRACEIDKICDFAKEKNILVIEDVAQALGGTYKGQRLGSFGDMGCFSFNKEKTITCGEGGAIVTSNSEWADRLCLVTDHAYAFNPKYKERFKDYKRFLGHSMRLSEISGAMLRVQLGKVDSILEENRKRKEIFCEVLEGETGHTFYHQVSSQEEAIISTKKLLEKGLMVMPLSMRLAHNPWQWGEYLEINKIDYVPTMDILMTTLRGEIDLSKSVEETKELASLLKNLS